MTLELIQATVSTYDAPSLPDKTPLSKIYAGFGNALVAQNRAYSLELSDDYNFGITGTASGWYMPWEYFILSISEMPVKSEKNITLVQARQVAIAALLVAERERKEESESEAKFWLNLEDE